MKTLLNNLTISHKLLTMVIISIGIFLIPAGKIWSKARADIEIAQTERNALPAMGKIMALLAMMQSQSRDSNAYLAEGKGKEKLATRASEIAKRIAEIRELKGVIESADLKKSLDAIEKNENTILERLSSQPNIEENRDAHNGLLDDIANFQADIAGISGLALDPEAVSYYLFDAAYQQLPVVITSLSQMRDFGISAINAHIEKNPSSGEYFAQTAQASQTVSSQHKQFQNRISKAIAEQLAHDDKEMADALVQISEQTKEQIKVLAENSKKLSENNKAGIASTEFSTAVDQSLEKIFDAQAKLTKLLDGELQQRITTIELEIRNLLIETGSLLCAMLLLTYLISRSITTPIAKAVHGAELIAEGNLDDTQLHQEGRNEISRLLQALDCMRCRLSESLKRERAVSTENANIRAALDSISSSVMIADAGRNIIYVNSAQAKLLADVESDIRKDLPQFDAKNIIGINIDGFHKSPGHQRNILGQLRDTHTARLSIGGRRFRLIMNPIRNDKGESTGTVVEWADETEMLALREREVALANDRARINAALNGTSTNVMIADNDRKIIYLNDSVTKMLRIAENDLRKALPNFSVDKVLGGSMDAFHRNPTHQANLLATLSTTYKAKIKVGGRSFNLFANPIFNEAGERLGTVVEWSDITREVAIEQEVAALIDAANRGDFKSRIDLRDKTDFHKTLAESLNKLMEVSDRGLAEVVRMLGALTVGDLTQRIEGEYFGTFGQLKDDSNATAEKLGEIIMQIKEATDTISTASQEIADGNQDLSQRTENQAASLEETAATMEELTSTVKQNAESAKLANQLAHGASDIAVKGGAVVGQVVKTMQEINTSARKVVEIISVVDGIAFQTNILALNAAVEAARAGEQGRGFAVVASEVRNLAQRSAAAAKEIKLLIGDSVDKVDSGSKLVSEAGRQMDEVVGAVKRVTDIMTEITNASIEQSDGIAQVNTVITQMDEMTQQNAALVEQAAAAAQSMADQSQMLASAVATFRLHGQIAPVRTQINSRKPGRPAAIASAMPPRKSASKPLVQHIQTGSQKDSDEWEEF